MSSAPSALLPADFVPLPGECIDKMITRIKALVTESKVIDARFHETSKIITSLHLDGVGRFEELRQKYIALVWKSKSISGQAQTFISDFCGDVLEFLLDETVPDAEKIEELENTMEEWKKASVSASQLRQDFADLSESLQGFEAFIKGAIDIKHTEEGDLCLTIGELHEESVRMGLESVSKGTNGLIHGALNLIYRGASIGTAVLGNTLWGSTNSAINENNALNEDNGSISNTAQDQRENNLESNLANLQVIRMTLDELTRALDEIQKLGFDLKSFANELQQFGEVYNQLIHEALEISSKIQSHSPAEDNIHKIVEMHTNLPGLKRALQLYAMGEEEPPEYTFGT